MLPAIDHAHLTMLKSVDTSRVSEHRRSKDRAFSQEMNRLSRMGEDRPAPPKEALAPRGKLEPLGADRPMPRRQSDAFIPVRGIDVDHVKRVSLEPLAKAARAKILMTNPMRRETVKPLCPHKVLFMSFLFSSIQPLHAPGEPVRFCERVTFNLSLPVMTISGTEPTRSVLQGAAKVTVQDTIVGLTQTSRVTKAEQRTGCGIMTMRLTITTTPSTMRGHLLSRTLLVHKHKITESYTLYNPT